MRMRRLGWELAATAGSLRRAFTSAGRERDACVQALKAAGAAVAAWAVVGAWWDAPMALMAPWTAVALVQGTVYRSVRTGIQQLALIAAGTFLAAGAAMITGNVMAAMALALPPAALLGIHNRFGDQGVYAPTTVIFALAYGTLSGEDMAHRLAETAVGAVIGISVNALLLPPVHLRGVEEALSAMAREHSSLLRMMADDLAAGYAEEDAARWRGRVAQISATLEGLRNARIWNRESYRFNPGQRMRRGFRDVPSIDHDAYWERFLDRTSAIVDNLAAAAGEERGLAQPPPARLMLARLLGAVADVCEWDRTRWGLHSDEADLARRDAAEDRAEQALARLKSGLADEEPETVVTVGALSASGQQLLRLLGGASGTPGVRS
ncbi:aromatic acid exporter family protein [Streptomyces sp. NBC_01428]|uniref:aromatic acid exporter family protein n=1 Tax=Streptomyces sp. NBC_01428 TaxID=2903861 RepID=UPI002E37110C|nr:aromatic acid exporter family protein [Streptomyces sp. NBC_01428]